MRRLLILLLLAGCNAFTPTEPDAPIVDIHDNAGAVGPVVVNVTDGSNSPASSAPCGATGAPQKGNGQAAPTPNCSSSTTDTK